MASLLNINVVTPSPLLSNKKIHSVYVDNYIYFITDTNIYRYDITNNIIENLKALEYVGNNSNIVVKDNILYFYNLTSNVLRLVKYIIDDNILEYITSSSNIDGGNNDYISIFIKDNVIYRYMLERFAVQYVATYIKFSLVSFNIETSSFTTLYRYAIRGEVNVLGKFLGGRGQPIVYNNKVYYFNNMSEGFWDDYTSYEYNNNITEYDIVSNEQKTLSITFPIKLVDYGCYVKDDLIIIVGGYDLTNNKINTNIYTFNPINYEINISSELIEGVYNIECVGVDDIYVLGGALTTTYSYTPTNYYSNIQKFSYIEYNNTYTLSNNDGEIIYKELTNNSPITSIRFNYDDNEIGYVITTLSDVISGTYTPQIPQGYKLIGYSLTPNSYKAIFGLNRTIEYNITESTTLYEVYGKYRPLTTSFRMTLYKNSAEFNRVDKTEYLEIVGDVSGVLREETDIINPSINIETPFINFNYVYIETFNRYYYVKNITSIRTNIWRVGLAVDVLMSYKDLIRQQKALIGRQENYYNKYLIDTEIICESNKDYSFIEIPNDILNTEESQQPSFIATILGAISQGSSTK